MFNGLRGKARWLVFPSQREMMVMVGMPTTSSPSVSGVAGGTVDVFLGAADGFIRVPNADTTPAPNVTITCSNLAPLLNAANGASLGSLGDSSNPNGTFDGYVRASVAGMDGRVYVLVHGKVNEATGVVDFPTKVYCFGGP